MTEGTQKNNQEAPQREDIGVLYERVPQAGVVVQGYDIDVLLTHPDVHEVEIADYQRAIGASRAVKFTPGIKDQFHWEYSEYMIFDGQNRPMATSKNEGGISYSRLFDYDELGRLIKRSDDEGFIYTEKTEYFYVSKTPDENGHFLFTLIKRSETHLR